MSERFELKDTKEVLLWALFLFFLGQILDIGSSILVHRLITTAVEMNPYHRDPMTHKFILWKSILVKSYLALFFALPMSIIFKKAFNSWLLSSLPWWVLGFYAYDAAIGNVLQFMVDK